MATLGLVYLCKSNNGPGRFNFTLVGTHIAQWVVFVCIVDNENVPDGSSPLCTIFFLFDIFTIKC